MGPTLPWPCRSHKGADPTQLSGARGTIIRPTDSAPLSHVWVGIPALLSGLRRGRVWRVHCSHAHLLHVLASIRSWAQCRSKKGLGKNELESYAHLAPGGGCAGEGCHSDTTAREGRRLSHCEGHWQPGWLGFWEAQVPGLRAEGRGWERLWALAVETCCSPDSIIKSR